MSKKFVNVTDERGATNVMPEPLATAGGMFECLQCGQTFTERDTYYDHYKAAHT